MKLSQALLISCCCLGMFGCATFGSRTRAAAPPPAPGPDQFAPPPQPQLPPSTITVKPYNLSSAPASSSSAGMYNMESSAKPSAKAKRSSVTSAKPAKVKKVVEEEVVETTPQESQEESSQTGADAMESPNELAPVPSPVRKSEPADIGEEEEGAPQSSLPASELTPAPADEAAENAIEVVPVSAPVPVPVRKLDSKFAS